METLPPEMVEKVTQYLAPQDLAHLCAVSRRWREIFNEDLHWKFFCDTALEETLRTTPSVAEPKFISPENEDSTLTPISRWRLAILREKHLWKNWKLKNFKKESISKLKDEFQVDFLTDDFIVRWCSNQIEIWDVSASPAKMVAKTDSSVHLGGCFCCAVVGDSMLITKQWNIAQVFDVDISNKRIKLKHNIFLGDVEGVHFNDDSWKDYVLRSYRNLNKTLETCVKRNILLHVDASGSKLDIFDLEIGKKIKSEPCPELEDENVVAYICAMKSSDTSDDLVIIVGLHLLGHPDTLNYHYHVYSTKDLRFLPGPLVESKSRFVACLAIHRHYLAIGGENTSLKIINYITSEVLFEQYFNSIVYPSVFNDSFIFLDYDYQSGQGWLKMFSPSKKTLTTIVRHGELYQSLEIISDRFVILFDIDRINILSVWEPSGQSLKQSSISDPFRGRVNKVFTRGFENLTNNNNKMLSSTTNIYYYW